jgi:hypothetical protein
MAELLRSGRWDDGGGIFNSDISHTSCVIILLVLKLRKADLQDEQRLVTSLYSVCREWTIDQQRKTK